MKRFTLQIVKVKSTPTGIYWAIKAVVGNKIRYRVYYYKAEAEKNMETWVDCESWYFPREFYHNFNSAEELGIEEVK